MLKKLYFKKERKFSLPEKFDPKQDPVIGGRWSQKSKWYKNKISIWKSQLR